MYFYVILGIKNDIILRQRTGLGQVKSIGIRRFLSICRFFFKDSGSVINISGQENMFVGQLILCDRFIFNFHPFLVLKII